MISDQMDIDSSGTGRYLVLYHRDAAEAVRNSLRQGGGMSVASSSDFSGHAVTPQAADDSDVLMLEHLGAAVISSEPERLQMAIASSEESSSAVLAIEPEGRVQIMEQTEYLRGYQDGVNSLIEKLAGKNGRGILPQSADSLPQANGEVIAEAQLTWGLQLTLASKSKFTGKGVRVAVLDTGLAADHPDFLTRAVTSASFMPEQPVEDGHGHGTHCCGTIAGMAAPVILPRYGLAPDVELFVGKVLNNNGGGQDGAVLMGMNWAIENKCRIVSMSLGTIVSADKPYNPVFEASAQRALQSGTLIVAAAGNNSDRASGVISPVTHPANCPSIMAVSALDSSLKVANFANGGLNSKGGQIDVIGPGVKIYSSWLMPTRYRAISGTSMATPHVAAVAALIAEANPTMSGQSLWARIVQTAKRLPLPASDVGAGLVQAP